MGCFVAHASRTPFLGARPTPTFAALEWQRAKTARKVVTPIHGHGFCKSHYHQLVVTTLEPHCHYSLLSPARCGILQSGSLQQCAVIRSSINSQPDSVSMSSVHSSHCGTAAFDSDSLRAAHSSIPGRAPRLAFCRRRCTLLAQPAFDVSTSTR